MVRYTELSPTGSETWGTDRQSESVAATNGPIAHLLLPQGRKSSMISRARAWARIAGSRTAALCFVLGHKNIRYTVRHTELSPDRFRNFWR